MEVGELSRAIGVKWSALWRDEIHRGRHWSQRRPRFLQPLPGEHHHPRFVRRQLQIETRAVACLCHGSGEVVPPLRLATRNPEHRSVMDRMVAGVHQEVDIGEIQLSMDKADLGGGRDVRGQGSMQRDAELRLVSDQPAMCAGRFKKPVRQLADLGRHGFGIGQSWGQRRQAPRGYYHSAVATPSRPCGIPRRLPRPSPGHAPLAV